MNIAVAITCHDRRETTKRFMRSLAAQVGEGPYHLDLWLGDDGCTDGTVACALEEWPGVRVVMGTGHDYWNGGMHRVISQIPIRDYDYALLANDDVVLASGAISSLIEVANSLGGPGGPIVVTGVIAVSSGNTYGGLRRVSRVNPLRVEPVGRWHRPVEVDTVNGNCLLLSKATLVELGNLDPIFTHKFGDYDLGFRAKRLGIPVVQAPGTHGTGSQGPKYGATAVGSGGYLRLDFGPKGLPAREWLHYARRHGGRWWILIFVGSYVRGIAQVAVSRFTRRYRSQS